MKPFRLLKETDTHFVVHDGKATFPVAKGGLQPHLIEHIRNFARGGQVALADVRYRGDPDSPLVNGDGGMDTTMPMREPDPESLWAPANSGEAPLPYHGYPNPDAAMNPQNPPPETEPGAVSRYLNENIYRPGPGETSPLAGIGKAGDQYFRKNIYRDQAQTPAVSQGTPASQGTSEMQARPSQADLGQPDPSLKPGDPGFVTAYNKAFEQAESGINQRAKVANDLGSGIANEINKSQQQLSDLGNQYKANRARLEQESDAALAGYRDGKIDPNHVWNSLSTGQKIGGAIALIFGGVGSALARQPNYAMEIMNKAIDRDIDAQKTNLNKSGNLYRMNLDRLHDRDAAYEMTRLQALTAVQAKIDAVKATVMGPEAQANATVALAGIQQQRAQLLESLSQRQAMANVLAGGNAPTATTLASLPPEAQGKLLKQRVYVSEERPIMDPRTGQQAVSKDGRPLTQTVAVPRFGLDEDAAKKAREGLMESRVQLDKLRQLETFHKLHPWGSLSPSQRQYASNLAQDFALSFNKTQEGNARLNNVELDIIEGMTKNPGQILPAILGQTDASLKALHRAVETKKQAIMDAHLIPSR